VVAMAALDRLALTDRPIDVLSPSVMLPQIGQGALALECREDDELTAALLAAIDDAESHRSLVAERALLEALGASCSVPVAGWARVEEGRLRLDGMLATAGRPGGAAGPRRGSGPPGVGRGAGGTAARRAGWLRDRRMGPFGRGRGPLSAP